MTGLDLKALRRAIVNAEQIITPRLIPWLIQHGNEPVPHDIADLIRHLMVKQPRDRTGSFSSSAAGTCMRRQELAFLGVPSVGAIDAQLQNIFKDGQWRHLRWQAMLLQADILKFIEMPLTWQKMRSKGAVDGVGVVPDDHGKMNWRGKEFGFELKGVSNYQFAKYKHDGPKEDHLDQVHRYFLSGGFDLFSIIYEDKTTQEWIEWVIEPDTARLSAQGHELQALNQAIDHKSLHPMLPNCKRRTGPVWYECPFTGRMGPCETAGVWPTPHPPQGSVAASSAP